MYGGVERGCEEERGGRVEGRSVKYAWNSINYNMVLCVCVCVVCVYQLSDSEDKGRKRSSGTFCWSGKHNNIISLLVGKG